MEEFLHAHEIEVTALQRLVVALACGGAIGWQREVMQKGAGFRTHMLICMGACMFALIGLRVQMDFPMSDPLRLVQGVLLGIGFLSGGVIVTQGRLVRGLTTAAGLWVITAVGLSIGLGYYFYGIISTVFTLIVMTGFRLGGRNGRGTEATDTRENSP